MKREVLPPSSSSAKTASRKGLVGGKVLFGQTRDDMHRPAILSKLQTSKFLIRRETAGMDLSARAIKPKTAPPALRNNPEAELDTSPRLSASAPTNRASPPPLPLVNVAE